MSVYGYVYNHHDYGTREVTDEELKKIQTCLVHMLAEIMEVCDKYDIKPFIMYGCEIGMIRHDHAFIPWDDDLDLGMIREDYDKFATIMDKELSDRYVISAPLKGHKAWYRFIQLGRKGTKRIGVMTKDRSMKIPTNHVYIDVFPLDNVPEDPEERAKKQKKVNLLEGISGAVLFAKNPPRELFDDFKKVPGGEKELKQRMIGGRLPSFRSVSSWMHAVDRAVRYNGDSDHLVSAMCGGYYNEPYFLKEEILPLHRNKFCGVDVYEVNDPDRYLRHIYSDYMQLPPVSERRNHHAAELEIDEELLK